MGQSKSLRTIVRAAGRIGGGCGGKAGFRFTARIASMSTALVANVLSFTAELAPGLRLPLLGDLVICAPVVAREAREQGKPPAAHYAHLTIHGVLHLLGHDHQLEAPAQRMETLETRILAGLGIADPYADERERRPFG